MRILSIFVAMLCFSSLVFAASESRDKSRVKPITIRELISYGKKVLSVGGNSDKYIEKPLKTVRGRLFYVDYNTASCFYIINKGDWNVLVEFYPEKLYAVNSVLKIDGIIDEVAIYDKGIQSKKTVHVVLGDCVQKEILGVRSEYRYSFDDFARIAKDYYLLPDELRDLLPMPINKKIAPFTKLVSTTNKETRVINFRETIDRWQVMLQLTVFDKVTQKSLVEVKDTVIEDISIFRQGLYRPGKMKVTCGDSDIKILRLYDPKKRYNNK